MSPSDVPPIPVPDPLTTNVPPLTLAKPAAAPFTVPTLALVHPAGRLPVVIGVALACAELALVPAWFRAATT